MDFGIGLALNKWALTSGAGFCSLAGYEIHQVVKAPIATARHFSFEPMAMEMEAEPVENLPEEEVIEEVIEEVPTPTPTVEEVPEIKVEPPKEVVPEPKPVEVKTVVAPAKSETESYYALLRQSRSGLSGYRLGGSNCWRS